MFNFPEDYRNEIPKASDNRFFKVTLVYNFSRKKNQKLRFLLLLMKLQMSCQYINQPPKTINTRIKMVHAHLILNYFAHLFYCFFIVIEFVHSVLPGKDNNWVQFGI